MDQPQYQGILFPDRAENLQEKAFSGYRVFLEFWDPLARQLRTFYEGLALRRDSRALVVYAPQRGGKTLFARKLHDDFNETKNLVDQPDNTHASASNLWHRITGGSSISSDEGKLSWDLIRAATDRTAILQVENDKKWVDTATTWAKANRDRRCVVLMDNAERHYFLQGLVALEDADYLKLADPTKTFAIAAERFVALCREALRGCLFVLLTNNDLFALSLDEHVNGQHKGLLSVASLPLPGSQEKESVVRVNTNRLNPILYWFCLDKAGPDEKMAVYTALRGASTFPDSFAAVDRAIKNASPTRMGRPARKCMLTLIVLHDREDQVPSTEFETIASPERAEIEHEWLSIYIYDRGWAQGLLPDQGDGRLLESEWQLRIATLGRPFVSALVGADDDVFRRCEYLLQVVQRIHGPGTWANTRATTLAELQELVDNWPQGSAIDEFWSRGQSRAEIYESALRRLYPIYNSGVEGFLTYRPDYIVLPYKPCSILGAATGNIDDINNAIKRDAHVVEFTAIQDPMAAAIQVYLRSKLPNYVQIVREQ